MIPSGLRQSSTTLVEPIVDSLSLKWIEQQAKPAAHWRRAFMGHRMQLVDIPSHLDFLRPETTATCMVRELDR